ncbi:MAG: sugar transferase [Chloroflexota bacterium]|nr:MAG: hypothetical protein DIU68_07825 [Chloroflexota bacterium]
MAETLTLLPAHTKASHYFFLKRLIDLCLSILLLVLLLPIMIVIAIAIMIDSPGPVLFIQERVGSKRISINGHAMWVVQNFRVYKFRSMFHNAEEALHQAYIQNYVNGSEALQYDAHGNPTRKLLNDPRVTRVGKLLRLTSLDELPQLINVIKGDMSLVGPRPVPVYEFAAYQPSHRERLAALPGITGLWQVKARCQVPFEDQIRLDVEYVRNQSLKLDLQILLLTIPAVLSGRGAG